MTVTRACFAGTGSYVPENVVSNDDLSKIVDTSDEWITARSGIKRRHYAADGELTSDLAIKAAQNALDAAGLKADDIDTIIVATATPDETFPSTATKVQAALGSTTGMAFDIAAVCSGFVYALTNADALIRAGTSNRVMVIGAETFSRILDFEDRTTCVLFGDGAGAVILEGRDQPGTLDDSGILANALHSDGRYHDLLYVDGGVSSTGSAGLLRMEGREVFRHAVNNLHSVGEEVLGKVGFVGDDIDWVVPHQANKRIIDQTAKKLGIAAEKLILTIEDHGNTSAASVPLALDAGVRDGRIKKGDRILFEAMGGGLTWGAVVARW